MKKFTTAFTAALLIALSLIASVAAQAQDAGQVLRLSVGFRTTKNTVQMDDEKRKQVEALEVKARAAAGEQKFGEAVKYYSQGMALMRNQPWTPSRALGTALQLKLDRLIFDPGDAAKIMLSQIFALDEPVAGKLNGSIALKEATGENAKEIKALREVEPDFKNLVTLEVAIPTLADGVYQIVLTLSPKDGEAVIKTALVRVERGLMAKANALKTRVAAVRNDLHKRHQQSLRETMPAVESTATMMDQINTGKLDADNIAVRSAISTVFAMLDRVSKQESAILALPAVEYTASMVDLVNGGELRVERTNLTEAIDNASGLLAAIEKNEHPLRTKRGNIHWAYRSTVDDTLQPYRFYIPSNYDVTRKWPLVIALHGMGGDEHSFFTAYDNGAIRGLAEERGYIIACPKGRQPTSMYMGAAERDVIDVIGEMKRQFSIDDDRVYLMGHSMGGYGTWSVAVNNPTLFAALAPIAGGGSPITAGKLGEIKHIPWIVVHGDKDPTVPVEESRKMVKAGKDLGIKIKYNEVPGGNHGNIVVPAFKEIFDFFDAHRRQPKAAAKAASASGRSQ
jgi:predicted esterase